MGTIAMRPAIVNEISFDIDGNRKLAIDVMEKAKPSDG
jgi:hypothetical protein